MNTSTNRFRAFYLSEDSRVQSILGLVSSAAGLATSVYFILIAPAIWGAERVSWALYLLAATTVISSIGTAAAAPLVPRLARLAADGDNRSRALTRRLTLFAVGASLLLAIPATGLAPFSPLRQDYAYLLLAPCSASFALQTVWSAVAAAQAKAHTLALSGAAQIGVLLLGLVMHGSTTPVVVLSLGLFARSAILCLLTRSSFGKLESFPDNTNLRGELGLSRLAGAATFSIGVGLLRFRGLSVIAGFYLTPAAYASLAATIEVAQMLSAAGTAPFGFLIGKLTRISNVDIGATKAMGLAVSTVAVCFATAAAYCISAALRGGLTDQSIGPLHRSTVAALLATGILWCAIAAVTSLLQALDQVPAIGASAAVSTALFLLVSPAGRNSVQFLAGVQLASSMSFLLLLLFTVSNGTRHRIPAAMGVCTFTPMSYFAIDQASSLPIVSGAAALATVACGVGISFADIDRLRRLPTSGSSNIEYL